MIVNLIIIFDEDFLIIIANSILNIFNFVFNESFSVIIINLIINITPETMVSVLNT